MPSQILQSGGDSNERIQSCGDDLTKEFWGLCPATMPHLPASGSISQFVNNIKNTPCKELPVQILDGYSNCDYWDGLVDWIFRGTEAWVCCGSKKWSSLAYIGDVH